MGSLIQVNRLHQALCRILFSVVSAFLALTPLLDLSANPPGTTETIQISHPGDEGKSVSRNVFTHMDKNGEVCSYSMVVESVVCLDVKCEIIPVTLYWDVLGRYQKFELPENGALTKKDHILFSTTDYAKLDEILADPRSMLKDLDSSRLVDPDKAIQTVDGVSAPTPISLQQHVVDVAAYTCYTLWHWANGEIVEWIRTRTAARATLRHLLDLYRTGKLEEVEFSLELLQRRGEFSQSVIDVITRQMANQGDAIKPALRFLAAASAATDRDCYYRTIEKVFANCGTTERVHILESLNTAKLHPPLQFYDAMSHFLPSLETYYETHLLLELEARYNSHSKALIHNTVILLNRDNFLIARRAYWFLRDRELEPVQSQAVQEFASNFAERL